MLQKGTGGSLGYSRQGSVGWFKNRMQQLMSTTETNLWAYTFETQPADKQRYLCQLAAFSNHILATLAEWCS